MDTNTNHPDNPLDIKVKVQAASRRSSIKHYWQDPAKAREAARKRSREYREKKKRRQLDPQDVDVVPTSSSLERELPQPQYLGYSLLPTDCTWPRPRTPEPVRYNRNGIRQDPEGISKEESEARARDFDQIFVDLDREWAEMEECESVEALIVPREAADDDE